MYIRVAPGIAIFGHGHARTSPQGANERVLLTDLRSVFIFFSWHLWLLSHFRLKFTKTKGDPLVKKMKKNRFSCLIPQKNRIEKCRLVVKSVFENIGFCGSYGLKSIEKWPKSPKSHKMAIFRYFLAHYFHKNQYFSKPISLPIYIFQCGSFDVSNMKINFFNFFFTKGSPLWFLRISKRKDR